MDISQFQPECTPSYFNNEGETQVNARGEKTYRWYLGDVYSPGFYAFETLLKNWRDRGDLAGLVLQPAQPVAAQRKPASAAMEEHGLTQPA